MDVTTKAQRLTALGVTPYLIIPLPLVLPSLFACYWGNLLIEAMHVLPSFAIQLSIFCYGLSRRSRVGKRACGRAVYAQ